MRVSDTFTPEGNCSDGAFPLAGLIADQQGGLYGTTYEGGGNCPSFGTVFKLTLPRITNQPPPATLACGTLCQRAPQYYLNNLSRLPNGTVQIAGGRLNSTISTGNTAQMRIALAGGNSPQGRFNQQFVAAQLSLLAAPGGDQGALQSPLSCYRLDFAPVRMRNGSTPSSSSSLGELLSQARNSARGSDAADLLTLAAILGQLNGNDPTGRCSTGSAP